MEPQIDALARNPSLAQFALAELWIRALEQGDGFLNCSIADDMQDREKSGEVFAAFGWFLKLALEHRAFFQREHGCQCGEHTGTHGVLTNALRIWVATPTACGGAKSRQEMIGKFLDKFVSLDGRFCPPCALHVLELCATEGDRQSLCDERWLQWRDSIPPHRYDATLPRLEYTLWFLCRSSFEAAARLARVRDLAEHHRSGLVCVAERTELPEVRTLIEQALAGMSLLPK